MNASTILTGLAGGLAAALLFAAIVGGGALAAPLFALSPLPVAIVSLGWGSLAGFIAALAGSAIVAGLSSIHGGYLFLLITAAPMAWYAHLAGLAQVGADGRPQAWYPLGRILTAMALVTPLVIVVAGALIGASVEEIAQTLTDVIVAEVRNPDGTALDAAIVLDNMRLYVRLMPVTVSMLWLTLSVFNLWLAARIVMMSGRLRRPWVAVFETPDLLPRAVLPGLAAAIVAAFALSGNDIGLAAGALAGSLAMALALVGFAVVHLVLRDNPAKSILLSALYGATFLFSLPLLPVMIAGAADVQTGIRARRLGSGPRQPPLA